VVVAVLDGVVTDVAAAGADEVVITGVVEDSTVGVGVDVVLAFVGVGVATAVGVVVVSVDDEVVEVIDSEVSELVVLVAVVVSVLDLAAPLLSTPFCETSVPAIPPSNPSTSPA